ncbi:MULTISPECIES: endonuclease/exonuclease/phosphatase family protein [unclassified Rathayibacter]|uniref:endonuclease/exonuclease/phosphatase family protein n=1 Tax=unclassified Rathayibacter TaxID=2609250 RepID=UPI0010498C79|nr:MULTISPECIES: endonuclease/exonuclease/phosphatase family protein [unclassified Rathayibacter]TCL81526.1 endonuclease/exonuclease/phosphatase (EEP) superfamily protein YafD [Rathayibacter sp. PhB192]TCM26214.1 endonuclease/exonuclease/phosphatase (EEP) superfamily protein YafD [Rathayibacter sp. PhB179]
MGTRLVKFAVALAVAIVLLVVAAPGFFGLAGQTPFAQLVSFRAATALAAVAGAVVLVVVAVLVEPVRRLALVLGALAVALALVLGGLQAVRGNDSAPPRAHRLGDLRVLSWNLLHDGVPAETVAALANANAADAVALLEVSQERAQQVVDVLAAAGRPMTLHLVAGSGPSDGTALLLSPALGGYSVDAASTPTATSASLVARPDTPDRPVIAAVHTTAPLPAQATEWRSDLARLADLCTAEEDLVVLGDLNSTLDHWSALPGDSDLGGCADAGRLANAAAVGSWPTSLPPALAAPIDHVLFSGRWDVSGFDVLNDQDDAGSDHRPVIAQLSVRGMVKESS